jgi:hypothetical protein
MKAQLVKNVYGEGYKSCPVEEATHITLRFPGPTGRLTLPIKPPHGWEWNGSVESPTLKPSVLTTMEHLGRRCHSYVTEGKVNFLDDCSHEFKGQTVELLDLLDRDISPPATSAGG